MATKPSTAMILAAGLGLRMRPLTLTTPKPLLMVAGKPIIDYGVDKLVAAGVTRALVNKHYLPDQIETWAHSVTSLKMEVSDETDAVLETGGGIVRALPRLGANPFYVLNSDCFWTEQGTPALQRLSEAWDDAAMDCLLLLCDPRQTTGYDGAGDFALDSAGRLTRQKQNALAYIGGYIVHPRLFAGTSPGKFSMNILWDKAIAEGRLFGIAHAGHWLHVGTPDAIDAAEAYLKQA
ncbi:nucleotidyltransferase family protein [Aestuariivirga litoralis]|uniref:nucleotidyltransferase family protein n=1 Tax=Aestuariivirga litoralis TaxID=2650924 RepID=UPI001FEE39BC|nr:nucleotidyltransferase family protein [Aestuariivirga litoralis]